MQRIRGGEREKAQEVAEKEYERHDEEGRIRNVQVWEEENI